MRPDKKVMDIQGTCYTLFAYDVGLAVNLEGAALAMAELRRRTPLGQKRRAPPWAEQMTGPLISSQVAPSIDLGICRTEPQVELVIYEFGAVSVTYTIPVQGSLENLVDISAMLGDAMALADDSRERVKHLLTAIRGAVQRPYVAMPMEDYAIFSLQLPAGTDISCLANEYGTIVARILRGERSALSTQESTDALAQRISYGEKDVTLADWHAAIVVGEDTSEERWVLEYANVELLELRLLDSKIDRNLDDAYIQFSQPERLAAKIWGALAGTDMHSIAQLQTDTAILYEGVHNSFKLLGDQYLARLYRAVSGRLHLSEWDASIERKMRTWDSIYQKMSDRASGWRTEALEWIIIALIMIETVPALFPGLFHK